MEIVEFRPEHAAAFRELNVAWISKYFALEPADLKPLDDPQGYILDRGGKVFMAFHDDRAVGCVALLKMADGGYEVAKMTVVEELRGTGLGRRLMQRCIDAARAAGAPRLYLETNSGLAPAMALYRTMGFRDLPSQPTQYARCDVWMERPL
jgi:putative acetyltransferase